MSSTCSHQVLFPQLHDIELDPCEKPLRFLGTVKHMLNGYIDITGSVKYIFSVSFNIWEFSWVPLHVKGETTSFYKRLKYNVSVQCVDKVRLHLKQGEKEKQIQQSRLQ